MSWLRQLVLMEPLQVGHTIARRRLKFSSHPSNGEMIWIKLAHRAVHRKSMQVSQHSLKWFATKDYCSRQGTLSTLFSPSFHTFMPIVTNPIKATHCHMWPRSVFFKENTSHWFITGPTERQNKDINLYDVSLKTSKFNTLGRGQL